MGPYASVVHAELVCEIGWTFGGVQTPSDVATIVMPIREKACSRDVPRCGSQPFSCVF